MGGGKSDGGASGNDSAGGETITSFGSTSTTAIAEDNNQRKQNHCEIEKRRRDKMNHYIMELASVLPPFTNNQSKLDKLTVLRMAVQHVKSLRSSLCSFSSFHLRPSFLSSGDVLKNLILQMASQEAQDNLFMVITCDRGKVLFVSKSSKNILNQEQNELVGQSLFDILHKDDVSKVKEQISYSNLMPKELMVDSRTLQPIKVNQRQSFVPIQNRTSSTFQPGARRSFFCRIKSGRIWSPSLPKPFSAQPAQATNCQNLEHTQHHQAHRIVGTKSRASKETQDNQKQQSRSPSTQAGSTSPSAFSSPSSFSPGSSTSGGRVARIDSRGGKGGDSNVAQPNESSQELQKAMALGSAAAKDKSSTNNSLSSYNSSSGISSAGSSWRDSHNGRNDNSKRNKSESSSSARKDSTAKHQKRSDETPARNQTTSKKVQASTTNHSNDPLMLSSRIETMPLILAQNEAKDPPTIPRGSQDIVTKRTKSSRTESVQQHSSQSRKQWRYIVMHCTGYLKSITLRGDEFDEDEDESDRCESDSGSNSGDHMNGDKSRSVNCLVAVCRRSVLDRDLKPDRPLTFTCRYSMEGKFVFVDQRTTVALGYTPQQLIGTSHYAYCHKDSVNTFKECHRQCILKSEAVSSDIYQFKRANGQHMWLQTSLKSFRNPWTKFIDYIVANHTTAEGNDPRYNQGCVPTKFNRDMTSESQSQSASPASTSSISLPSVESKKSSSPSSSSIESSYSMESYASGVSIQAVLNQIDRVKSGGIKHALDFSKGKHNCDVARSITSGSSSARKSNDDSGNFSDMQSCSSISSNNSASPADYLNSQNINQIIGNQVQPVGNVNQANLSNRCQRLNRRVPTVQHQQSRTQTSCQNNVLYPRRSQQNQSCSREPSNQVQNIEFVSCNKELSGRTSANQQLERVTMNKMMVDSVQSMDCATNQSTVTNQQAKQNSVACSGKSGRDPMNQEFIQQQQHHPQQHHHHQQQQQQYQAEREQQQQPGGQYQQLHGKTMESNDRIRNSQSWLVERSPERSIYQTMLPDSSHNEHIAHRQIPVGNVEHNSELRNNTANELERTVPSDPYEFNSDELQAPIVLVPEAISLQNVQVTQIQNYPSELSHQVENYMASSVSNHEFQSSTILNQEHGDTAHSLSRCDRLAHQTHVSSTQMSMQQTPQSQPEHQHQNGSGIMVWNSVPSSSNQPTIMQPFQNIVRNIIPEEMLPDCRQPAPVDAGLINMDISSDTGQMIAQQHQPYPQQQQVMGCQQCAGHKCCANQPMMMANSHVDFNSLQLSSLAVDDLDENELLECLAACDPDSQLYNVQNNSYSQYNIYRD